MTELEKLHAEKVNSIRDQLKILYKQKKKVRIYHGTITTTRKLNFKKGEIIDISDLNEILEINQKENYLVAESNVSMETLFNETIKTGLVPPVVMESPGITIGGGIQGGAGESGSFKWGLFHETCLEYEILLGNGDILNASRNENSDLFWGIVCSYGTLGIITKIKLKLIPATKFVRVMHYRTKDFSETIHLMQKSIRKPIDFLDGILYSKNKGVVTLGNYTNNKNNLPISRFTRAIDDWYYLHVKNIIDRYETYEELIPLKDYIFRYDRGVFWTGEYIFKKLRIPFNRITRFLFNPIMNYKKAARLLQNINISQKSIVQDICVPQEHAVAFLEFSDQKINMYPVFLCAGFPSGKNDKLSFGFLKKGLVINVGLYGFIPAGYDEIYKLNRDIEITTKNMKGRKWFYSHVFYPEKEFWEIYDYAWYKNLRKICYAEDVFPDIYEKVRDTGKKYEVSILKGLLNFIKSPAKIPVS